MILIKLAFIVLKRNNINIMRRIYYSIDNYKCHLFSKIVSIDKRNFK